MVKYGNYHPKSNDFPILENRSVAHFLNVPHLSTKLFYKKISFQTPLLKGIQKDIWANEYFLLNHERMGAEILLPL